MELFGAFIGIVVIIIGMMCDKGAFGRHYLSKKDWEYFKARSRENFYRACRDQYPDEKSFEEAFDKHWEMICETERRNYNITPKA